MGVMSSKQSKKTREALPAAGKPERGRWTSKKKLEGVLQGMRRGGVVVRAAPIELDRLSYLDALVPARGDQAAVFGQRRTDRAAAFDETGQRLVIGGAQKSLVDLGQHR